MPEERELTPRAVLVVGLTGLVKWAERGRDKDDPMNFSLVARNGSDIPRNGWFLTVLT